MLSLLSVCLMVVVSVSANDNGIQIVEVFEPEHDMIVCNEQPGDKLLHRQMVQKKYSLLSYVNATVQYPLDGVPRNETIHCVKVLDQRIDGTGGFSGILEGGLGLKEVTIYMRSQLSRGFRFIIEISGQ